MGADSAGDDDLEKLKVQGKLQISSSNRLVAASRGEGQVGEGDCRLVKFHFVKVLWRNGAGFRPLQAFFLQLFWL